MQLGLASKKNYLEISKTTSFAVPKCTIFVYFRASAVQPRRLYGVF